MNPPDDDDRSRAIAEQWWPGILFWVVLASIVAVASKCQGAPMNIVWNPAPAWEIVTHWNIYRAYPLPRLLLATATDTRATIDVQDGDYITVTACNLEIESPESLPLIVHFPPPNPIARVTIQTSNDLTTWQDFSSVDMPESIAKYFRLKIEKP